MRNSLEQLGQTQQQLIRLLRSQREGLSIDALRSGLNISRNAVRQHLSALLAQGFVAHGSIAPTGGRPERRFILTDAGRELFPRRYVELASSMIREIGNTLGQTELAKLLTRLGNEVGKELGSQLEPGSSAKRCTDIAAAMVDLGYEAHAEISGTSREIYAKNCVFHDIAREHPAVCRFDLALLARASGQNVEHSECIVRGGNVCRFRFVRDVKR
jgi:predicted ArsR family transcriptional regulator